MCFFDLTGGVDVNEVNAKLEAPLYIAVGHAPIEVVEAILKAGSCLQLLQFISTSCELDMQSLTHSC